MSQQIGYEIAYTLKNVSGAIYEMVYANGPSQAEAIVKAKFNSDAFLFQPRYTGKHTKTQSQIQNELAQEKRRVQSEQEQNRYVSPEETAKKEEASETLIMLGAIGIAGIFIYILLLNIFNFNKIFHYDFGLYFSNIKSFYNDGGYRYTTQPINIRITSPDDFQDNITIPKNRILVYEGKKEGENNVTLLALSYLDKDTQVYGYFIQKPNDKSLKKIDSSLHSKINVIIKRMYDKELAQKVDLIKINSQKESTELESKGYEILEEGDLVFAYKEEDEDKVESIKDKYYSAENYQKLYIQIGEHILRDSK